MRHEDSHPAPGPPAGHQVGHQVGHPPATRDLEVELTPDPAAFLDTAAAFLERDPLLGTVVASVTYRAVDTDERGGVAPVHPRWWATVRTAGGAPEVVGVAMRTAPFPPHPLYVLPMPEDAARALALALHERGEAVGGVNGPVEVATALAGELVRLGGGSFSVVERTRLFELGDLLEPPPVPGRLRPAGADDADLVVAWLHAFRVDADEQAGRPPGRSGPELVDATEVRDRIRDRRIFLWEDPVGEPVHLTAINPPSFGVARIGPVYTPRESRGRGFASAAVAEVSRRLRDTGARVCLFTDQANPTSNRIYRALGYRAVADTAALRLDGEGSVAAAA